MKQQQLNRAVARSTGESLAEITRRGFIPLEDLQRDDDPPIDWDRLQAEHATSLFQPQKREAA